MNRKLKNGLKLGIGLGILFYLVYHIGVDKVLNISIPNWYYLLLVLPFFILFSILSTYCIKALVDPISLRKIGVIKLFKYYLYSWMIGLLLPSKIGELSLAYFLKKEDMKLSEGLAVSVIDKIITLFFFIIVGLIGVFFVFKFKLAILLFISQICLCAGFLLLLFLLLKSRLKRYLPAWLRHHYDDFKRTINMFFTSKKDSLLDNLLFTNARWLINCFITYYVFLSLGLKIDFLPILVINVVSSIVSLIPISLNGLGIRQATGTFLYISIGVNSAIALNMHLIRLAISYTFAIIIFIVMFNENAHPKSLFNEN